MVTKQKNQKPETTESSSGKPLRVELKNVTYAAALSQETNAFRATIWVDGVKTAEVMNEGCGGSDNYWPIYDKARWAALHEHIKTLPPVPVPGSAATIAVCMEIFIGDLLEAHLQRKQMARHCRKKTLFLLKDDDETKGWRTIKHPFDATIKNALQIKYGDKLGRILNEELKA